MVNEKQRFFFIQRMDFAFFKFFFFFISIVICKLFPIPRRAPFCFYLKRKSLAESLELVKIEECPKKKESINIPGKERLLHVVIGLAKRPCI